MIGARRWATLVGVDATSGTVLVTGTVSAVAAVVTVTLMGRSSFLPGWADPLNAGLTITVYIAPLAAGAAALQSREMVARGIIALASTPVRGWRAATALRWASVTACQLVAFYLGLSLLLVTSDLHGPLSAAMLLLPISGTLAIALATMLGTLAGRFWPNWFASPLLAIVIFLAMFVASLATGRASVASLVFPATFYQVYLEPNVELLSGQILGVFSILLLGMSLLSGRRTGVTIAAIGAGTLLGSAFILRGVAIDPVQFRAPPSRSVCQSEDSVTLTPRMPWSSSGMKPAGRKRVNSLLREMS